MINTMLKQQGKIEEGRDMILLLLPKRLGSKPPKLEQAIRRANDLKRLQTVLASLLELQSWEEVEQLLNAETKA